MRESFSRARALIAALALAVALGAALPGVSAAAFKGGKYSGSTDQQTVSSGFKKIEFTIKKGKVTLTTEPVVNRGLCFSGPTFTLDGNPTKPLSKRGAFTFTKTFFGDKIDRIKGKFTSPNTIEGVAVYNFFATDLCTEGSQKVKFSATKGKSKKKK